MLKIKKLWHILNLSEKNKIIILVFLMTVGMFLELISISAIIPVIIVFFDQSFVFPGFEFIQYFISLFILEISV